MIFVILAFGVLIFIHEFAHFIVAKKIGVKVKIFSLGFGPKIFAWKKNDTEYRISIIPFGGYVKMAGDDPREERSGSREEFLSQPPGKRSLIILAGSLGNYILGYLLFLFLFIFGFPTLGTKIGKILENYPAQMSGLAVGDEIIAVDGIKVTTWEELTYSLHNKPKKLVEIKVKREEKIYTLKITTAEKEIVDFLGRKKIIGLIGITPDAENIFNMRCNPLQATLKAIDKVFEISRITFLALINLITGKLSFKESVAGPVGIFYLSSQAVRLGFSYFITLVAVISVSLAIFNLLPVPVLDGGHILFTIIEKIRRKPLSVKVQESLTQLGLILLLILVLFVTYFDLMKFFTK